jgi:hypothetical protein
MNTATGLIQAAVFQRFANFEHHFVGVNKMVPDGGSESRAGLEAQIAAYTEELQA